jgi:hypothetical protein
VVAGAGDAGTTANDVTMPSLAQYVKSRSALFSGPQARRTRMASGVWSPSTGVDSAARRRMSMTAHPSQVDVNRPALGGLDLLRDLVPEMAGEVAQPPGDDRLLAEARASGSDGVPAGQAPAPRMSPSMSRITMQPGADALLGPMVPGR